MSSAERKQGLIPVLTRPTGDQQQATERVAGHYARYQLPQLQRRTEKIDIRPGAAEVVLRLSRPPVFRHLRQAGK
jgi:hypothetical protein